MDLSALEIELLNKYLTGNLTEDESIQLLQWMNQSKENERLVHVLKDIYQASAWKKYFEEARTKDSWNNLKQYIDKRQKENRIANKLPFQIFLTELQKYAAVFLIGAITTAIVSYFIYNHANSSHAISYTTMSTAKGEKSQIILPDSTIVHLNSESSLTYSSDYGLKNRDVILNGEAFFEVIKRSDLAFNVNAENFNIKALGTKFSVSAYESDNEIFAVLVEGKISFAKDNGEQSVVLVPKQKVAYSRQTNKISVNEVSTNFYTAWLNGEVRFADESFGDIALKLERHFNMNIVFKNQKIKQTKYTGTFYNYDRVDIILKIFQKNKYFNYEIKKDTIYIK